ncbi:hypothetical protein ACRDNQ_04050 [Palleronia sp. KMU-117]|uniref:hypothetical protein n=1 Tax=Palleronia sp. KMU-117 TaxID=3434108 RepID=UPI003D7412FD
MKRLLPIAATYFMLLSSAAIAYIIFFSLVVPFSWYVDIDEYSAADTCVGSNLVEYHSERTPRWAILGESYGQMVLFTGQRAVETTITRGTPSEKIGFGYEPDTYEVAYQTRWDETFLTPGVYGANEWVTIYPLPFIEVRTFLPAERTQFRVVECE